MDEEEQKMEINAKKYLQKIKALDNQINIKRLELEDIYDRMKGVQGISYDREIVTSGCNQKSPQDKMMNKYIDYQEELTSSINFLMEYKKKALECISKIDDADCVDVLYRRYFQFKKWECIADEKGYSYQGIHKIHGRALKLLSEILKSIQK